MLKGAAVRSRATRSQAAWREGAAAQWTWRPQGPGPVLQDVHTNPVGVSGVLGECLAQSASRTPEQSVSQWVAVPFCVSFRLLPVPSRVRPQTPGGLVAKENPWPTQEACSR